MPELSEAEKDYLRCAVVYVPSESQAHVKYMVVRATDDLPAFCNCPAFRFHKGHNPGSVETPTCKHIRAVEQYDAELRQKAADVDVTG
jgi:hypothetical protein